MTRVNPCTDHRPAMQLPCLCLRLGHCPTFPSLATSGLLAGYFGRMAEFISNLCLGGLDAFMVKSEWVVEYLSEGSQLL